MPLHDDPDFQNFSGDTSRICLQCGYRWPIDDLNVARITENPGCPECGFATADILTECKAPNWDEDELLISARVEIEIFASTVEGFKTGWLKDRVDELLKVLIAADLDTCSRLSAAPASEYMGMPGFPPGAPGAAPATDATDLGRRVREFLDGLRSQSGKDRASKASGLFYQWQSEEHKN